MEANKDYIFVQGYDSFDWLMLNISRYKPGSMGATYWSNYGS